MSALIFNTSQKWCQVACWRTIWGERNVDYLQVRPFQIRSEQSTAGVTAVKLEGQMSWGSHAWRSMPIPQHLYHLFGEGESFTASSTLTPDDFQHDTVRLPFVPLATSVYRHIRLARETTITLFRYSNKGITTISKIASTAFQGT